MKKVYLVDIHDIIDLHYREYPIADWGNKEFKAEAIEQDNVYSLEEFEYVFNRNSRGINNMYQWIRILEEEEE